MAVTDNHPHPDNSFWVGLFLGGLIGALLIFFLGTDKGKKLAKKLEEKGLDFLDEAEEKIEEKIELFQDKGETLIEKGKELLKEGKEIEEKIAEKVVEAKDEVTQQVVAKADSALAHIEELQERGRQATEDLRQKLYFKNIPKKS
jgi:gas vesicle protein